MKNLKIKLGFALIAIIGFNSCDQDDSVARTEKPTIDVNNSITIAEDEDLSNTNIEFRLSDRVRTVENANIGADVGAEVGLRVVGGTAIQGEDYTFNLPTVFDSGFGFWGGDGYYVNIPGETLQFNLPLSEVITITDDFENEGTETIEILVTPVGLGQAFIEQTIIINITNNTVCPLEDTKFVGDYLIQQTSTLLDGPTLSDGSIVTLTATSVTSRTFNTQNFPDYCAAFVPWTINFSCTDVNSPVVDIDFIDSVCPCVDGTDYFGPAMTAESVDYSNDNQFTLTFTDDVNSDCATPAQTTYVFTKQ